MEEALRALLVGASAVTDLVSGRVFLGEAPENATKPYIIAHRIGGDVDYTMSGPSGLQTGRLQVEAWAAEYSTAKAIARAASAAISGYRGTVLGVEVQSVFVDGERDSKAEDAASSQTYHRVFFDASVSYC